MSAGGEAVYEQDVPIINIRGLHPRAAVKFVETAKRYQAQVTVARGRQIVDGKDIWDLLTLGAERGTVLHVRATGADAAAALAALAALVADKFEEGE